MAKAVKLQNVLGQPSWRLANKEVEVFLTKRGGHMGPATFFRGQGGGIQPLSIAPWYKEKLPGEPWMLRVLRGDFFCMPFGGNAAPYGKEKHPPHGETSNNEWKMEGIETCEECSCMTTSLTTTVRPGKVEKQLALMEGQNAIYIRHTISGMTGPMNYGHHAMLKWEKQGEALLSTSPIAYAQVFPDMFEDPTVGGYQCLKPGAEFTSLNKVPMANGGIADLSVYPSRLGFEDLVMLCAKPNLPFAWSAAVTPSQRVAWITIKDPKTLASTVLWHSNRGRHYSPWNSRHIGVLGLEEVTSYFHYGIAASAAPNPISKKGIPTCHKFKANEPYSIPCINLMVKVPAGFNHVSAIEPHKKGIRLIAKNGKKADAAINLDFLQA